MKDYLPAAVFMIPTLVVLAAAVVSFAYSTDPGEAMVSTTPPSVTAEIRSGRFNRRSAPR